MSQSVSCLFPESVRCVALRGGCELDVMAEEIALTGRMVAKRKRDFLLGRTCARRALRCFEIENFPLLVGADRAPVWPDGLVGSISHTAGVCGAVVASSKEFAGIGFDVERLDSVTEEIAKHVTTSRERAVFCEIGFDWRTTLFSIKETVYKAVSSQFESIFGFQGVEVVRLEDGAFEARLQIASCNRDLLKVSGRYFVDRDFVYSGAVCLFS